MALLINSFRIMNWHDLTDSKIVPLGHTTFLTGLNKSGKSTVIDALRLAVMVRTKGFNKANGARNSGETRTLESYVRGFEGIDRKNCRRKGETTTHIVVEIYNTAAYDSSFLVGVTVEAAPMAESTAVEPKWWIVDNCRLGDVQFVVPSGKGGSRFAKLSEIEKNIKSGAKFHNIGGQREAKRQLSVKLNLTSKRGGDANEFEQWARIQDAAIAYEPDKMGNMQEFICNMLLPKDDVQTDEFRGLLEENKRLQRTLNAMSLDCNELDAVCESFDAVRQAQSNVSDLEILWHVARLETMDERLKKADDACNAAEKAMNVAKQKDALAAMEERQGQEILSELQANSPDGAVKELQRSISATSEAIRSCEEKGKELDRIVVALRSFSNEVNNAFAAPVIHTAFLEQYQDFRNFAGDQQSLVSSFKKMMDSFPFADKRIEEMKYQSKQALDETKKELRDVSEQMQALQGGKPISEDHAALTKAKIAIKQAFQENGIHDTPRTLCELLDYKPDFKGWANAAEAFMGAYRFALIVKPENYTVAAEAVTQLRRANKNFHGVILVDTSSFAGEYDDRLDEKGIPIPKEGTLASIFACENPVAMAYVCYSYERVVLVDNAIQPSDRNGTYITKEGMRYSRRSYTPMRLMKDLVIGLSAVEAQREQIANRQKALNSLFAEQSKECSFWGDLHRSCRDKDMQKAMFSGDEYIDSVLQIPDLCNVLAGKRRAMEDLQVENLPILNQIAAASQKLEQCRNDRDAAAEVLREATRAYDGAVTEFNKARKELEVAENELDRWKEHDPNRVHQAEEVFAERRKNTRKGVATVTEDIKYELEIAKRKASDSVSKLRDKQSVYCNSRAVQYGLGADDEVEATYRNQYKRLLDGDLAQTQAQYAVINRKMEETFYKGILQDLASNIKRAQTILNDTNKCLAKSSYGGVVYQFASIKAAPGKEDFFKMLTTSNLSPAIDGQSSFDSMEFEAEFGRTIAQLIQNIENRNNGIDSTNWLDYRTYCQFDIKVCVEGAGPEFGRVDPTLSANLMAGSGAEVQIPCYIILTAALAVRYNKNNRINAPINDSNTLRFMCIDECFSKMDNRNCETMLNFISKDMGLQVLASAPTQRFSDIGTQTDVILYMQSDKADRSRDLFYFSAEEFNQKLDDGNIPLDD